MATTWAELATEGQGRVVYMLELAGIGVFGTSKAADPSGESWFDDAGYPTPSPWLVFDIDDLVERIDFATAELQVSNVGITLSDRSGQATELIKDARAWTHSRLTSTVSDTGTSIIVEDVGIFPASGAVHIGQERITYTGVDAGTNKLTGCTRGTYGTEALEHYADLSPPDGIPIQPFVCAGPHSYTGRRALIRAAVIDESTGEPGTSSVIYRGRVRKGARVGKARHDITIEHVSNILMEKVGRNLPQTTLKRSYWFSGSDEGRSRSYVHWHHTPGSLDSDVLRKTEVDAGLYDGLPDRLMAELNDRLDIDSGVYRAPQLYWDGDRVAMRAEVDDANDYGIRVDVREGDPLYALGFDKARHIASHETELLVTAENPPRWSVMDTRDFTSGDGWGDTGYPEIVAKNAGHLVSGTYAVAKEQAVVLIDSIDTDNGVIEISWIDEKYSKEPLWDVEKEEDATIQNCIRINASMRSAIEQLLYLKTGQVEKRRWLATGIRSDDIDFDELDDALDGINPELKRVGYIVKEPTSIWEIVGGQLAVLGICPRITTDGKIGFTRLKQPILSDADPVELDQDIWALQEASQVESRLDDAPVVSEIIVRYGLNHTKGKDGEWADPLRFVWPEGALIFERTRTIEHDCPGIWGGGGLEASAERLEGKLADVLTHTHFTTMGRESASLEIPCTWLSRQLYCGDVVKVTHPTAPDTIDGSIGITSRLGIVVGRRLKITDGGTDTLVLRLGPVVNAGGIAPCAYITSDDGTNTGTLASITVHSSNDLSYFAAGEAVRLFEWDSTTPSEASAEIDSFPSSTTVQFKNNVFASISAPCMMIPSVWSEASANHQAYAFVASDAATPVLGGSDTAMEWVI